MSKIIYSVVVSSNKLICINTANGSTTGSINTLGPVKNGPIVTDDRCVVVFETSNGLKGKVYKLPNFGIISSFNV